MSDIIFGRNSVEEAFRSGKEIEKVYMLNSMRGEFEVFVRNICREKSVPLAKVPEQKLAELCGSKVAHQGVAALISKLHYADYRDVISSAYERGGTPFVIVLDSVTDIRNIGAIARSAWFFGADGIILTGNISGSISEDAVKSSAGAILNIPVSREKSVFTAISNLQAMGLKVVATALKTSLSPAECDLHGPLAILMGSEEKGLHYKVLEVADEAVRIPSGNDFDSLNVSVAAGILLYEAKRQRMSATSK